MYLQKPSYVLLNILKPTAIAAFTEHTMMIFFLYINQGSPKTVMGPYVNNLNILIKPFIYT